MRGKSVSNALIGGQIAITLLLMAAAGAAVQGFLKLTHVALGYNPHYVMSVFIPVHEGTHPTLDDRSAYFQALLAKVAQTPGVTKAGSPPMPRRLRTEQGRKLSCWAARRAVRRQRA